MCRLLSNVVKGQIIKYNTMTLIKIYGIVCLEYFKTWQDKISIKFFTEVLLNKNGIHVCHG